MTNIRHKLTIPQVSVYDLKRGIHFPKEINENLAELVGIYLGDGHLAKTIYRDEYKFQITGHMSQDKFYYEKFVIPLIRNIFNIEPKLRLKSKENVFELDIYSKDVFLFLVNNFGLPIGRKENITIPRVFFDESNILRSCVRGIMDTDFYFSLCKDSISLGALFSQESLVRSLKDAFSHLNIPCKTSFNHAQLDKRTNKTYVGHRISMRRQSIDYAFRKIGTHHPMMALKYRMWKKGEFATSKDIMSNPHLLEVTASAFKFGNVYIL